MLLLPIAVECWLSPHKCAHCSAAAEHGFGWAFRLYDELNWIVCQRFDVLLGVRRPACTGCTCAW